MKFSKLLVGLLLGAFCAVALTACGKDSEKTLGKGTDEVVTLDLWHIWAADSESSKAPFENAVKTFNEEHKDIQVKLEATENETYKTKMATVIAGNEAPDIYFYWSGGHMQNIVEAGKLLPLDKYLEDCKDEIIDGTLTNMTFDDKVYGLGHSMSVGTFFVNKKLFKQYSVKIPENYDELVTAVKKFRENGITPMAVGAKEAWTICMYLDLMTLRGAGYDACNAALTKKASFEDAGIIDTAKKLQELIDLGAFTDGAMGVSRDESEVPFYNGEIPMYVSGSWTIGNVMKADSKIKDDISIVKFPVFGDKSNVNDFTGGVAEIFCINAATEYPDEAAAALKWISKKFSENLYLAGAGIPTWKVQVDESKIDRLTLELVDLIQDAKSFTLWFDTLLVDQDSQLYMNEVSELFAKQITPEQFVADLQTMNK